MMATDTIAAWLVGLCLDNYRNTILMLYEVPYNFDEALISFYQKEASNINYLYLPPYQEDANNTRSSIQTRTKGHCYMPQSRAEYEIHLHRIHSAGLRFVVLWQEHDRLITRNNLDYYCGMNASGFIVANDKNAAIIKDYNPELLAICSIVQRTCTDIGQKDLSKYDYVILYYPFNRGLDALKQLPQLRDKLVIMPNTMCNVNCPSIHHWFPTNDHPFDAATDCWMNIGSVDMCGLILPEHLHLFDRYVGGYKLQGREYPTAAIKYLCQHYFKRKATKDFVGHFFRRDMADKFYRLIQEITPEVYYNTKTPEIITALSRVL